MNVTGHGRIPTGPRTYPGSPSASCASRVHLDGADAAHGIRAHRALKTLVCRLSSEVTRVAARGGARIGQKLRGDAARQAKKP